MRAPRAVIVGGAAAVLAAGGFAAQAALGGGDGGRPELIHNGGFEDGAADWWTSGAAATATMADPAMGGGKVLRVQVPGGSSNSWDYMVGQTGFSLAQGEDYRLKFTARSDRPVTIRVTVQQEQAPYAIAFDKQVQLEKDKRTFELPFTAGQKIDGAALTFQLGGADGDVSVMLDGVSAKDGTEADTGPDIALIATAATAALVSAGAFGMHVRRRRRDAAAPGGGGLSAAPGVGGAARPVHADAGRSAPQRADAGRSARAVPTAARPALRSAPPPGCTGPQRPGFGVVGERRSAERVGARRTVGRPAVGQPGRAARGRRRRRRGASAGSGDFRRQRRLHASARAVPARGPARGGRGDPVLAAPGEPAARGLTAAGVRPSGASSCRGRAAGLRQRGPGRRVSHRASGEAARTALFRLSGKRYRYGHP
ncbi:carbohydrate binding domain-containing protein [Yinghuangia aomiensis]